MADQKKLLPAGKYVARADSWTFDTAKSGGIMLEVTWKVVVEPETKTSGGTTVPAKHLWLGYQYITFAELTRVRSIQSLRYMGWTGEDLMELNDNGGGLDANEVELVIEVEESTNIDPRTKEPYPPQNKVAWINSLGGVRAKAPPPRQALEAWSLKMRDVVRQVGSARGAVPNGGGGARPAPLVEPAGRVDDDIPF